MATIVGSTSNSAWTYKLEVSESAYNIENNTSPVTVTAYLGRASSQSYIGGTWSGSITVDGSTQYMSGTIPYPTYINAGEWYALDTKTFIVKHNDDGSKTVSISSSWAPEYGVVPSSASAGGSVSLATIPRKTPAPNIEAYVEDYGSLILEPKSSGFSHTVKLTFGSKTYYITQTGELTTSTTASTIRITSTTTFPIKFQIPTSFYAEFTGEEAVGTIEVTTYKSNNLQDTSIGTTTGKLTIKCSDKCKPILLTKKIIDINMISVDVSGDSTYLIIGKSTAQVTVTVQASGGSGDNNTTLTSVTINGKSANKSSNKWITEFANITTDTFEITMTNSRNLTKTEYFSNDGKVIDYFDPTFTGSVKRVEPTTGEVRLTFNGKYYKDIINIPNSTTNTLELSYAYKKKGASDWVIPDNPTISGWSNTSTGYEGVFNFPEIYDYKSQYEIIIYYKDALGTRNIVFPLTRGLPVFWWDANNFNVVGNTNELYSNGNDIRALPRGKDDRNYWNNLANGLYWYDNTEVVPNMPAQCGFVWKFGFLGHGDFSVIYFEQPSGRIYRKSGDGMSVTEWIKLYGESDINGSS